MKKTILGMPRLRFSLLTAVMAILLALVIAANTVMPYYHNIIDVYMDWNIPGKVVQEGGDPVVSLTDQWNIEDSHNKIREITQEGFVLLKNDPRRDGSKASLPLDVSGNDKKVAIFGTSSVTLEYGGAGSGSSSYANCINLQDGLSQTGFEVYDNLTYLYVNYKQSEDRTVFDARTETGIPEGINSGGFRVGVYHVDEFAADKYTSIPVDSSNTSILDGAKEFTDTAIMVVTRSGTEEQDLREVGTDWNGEYDPSLKSGIITYNRTDVQEHTHYNQLTNNEQDVIKMLNENFENVILILNGPNPIELGDAATYADSILWIGNPGEVGTLAVGEILSGTINPSGRTIDTWAYSIYTAPATQNFGAMEQGKYTLSNFATGWTANMYRDASGNEVGGAFGVYAEDIYVGYRWYETAYAEGFTGTFYNYDKSTLGSGDRYIIGDHYREMSLNFQSDYNDIVTFPFGYGLSYTEFDWEIADCKVDDAGTPSMVDDQITMDVKVTNIGNVSGKDVVQLYLTAPYHNNSIEKAAVTLAAYAKTGELAPGASETVSLTVAVRDMASWDGKQEQAYVLEQGDYTLSLRTDAHNVKAADMGTVFTVAETEIIKTAETGAEYSNKLDAEGNFEYLSRANGFENYDSAIRIYTSEERVADENILSRIASCDDHLALLDNFQTYSDPITTGNNQGIMLAALYGKAYDDPMWEDFLDQMTTNDMINLISSGYGTPSVASVGIPATIHQDGPAAIKGTFSNGSAYTGVSWPVGVVLASTWNPQLAYDMGDLIAQEGLHANCAGWYAPGVNIHRSPLGGRNFEYYSEDPLVSGMMAGNTVKAATEGGLIVMAKHFAMNEQETNRSGASFYWGTEQSLREIYIKAFEIMTKVGNGNGLMTGLERIGYEWCGEKEGLLNGIVRDEWGYEGLIITDAANRSMSGPRGIAAGTDLWLSGSNPADSLRAWVQQDKGTALHYLRNAAKNTCYVIANSDIAMNGLAPESIFADDISGTSIARTAINIVVAVYAVAYMVLLVLSWKKSRSSAT